MIGRPTNFFHTSEESLRKFQTELYPAIEKDEYFNLEYEMKRKDGSVFTSDHTVTPLLDDQEKRVGWISVIRDITERKRAEEKLRESEQLYRTLAESSPDDIFIVARDTRVQYMNRSGLEHFGLTLEEITGKKASDLFPPEVAKRWVFRYQQSFKRGNHSTLKMRCRFQAPFPGGMSIGSL